MTGKSMEISAEFRDDVLIVRVTGRLDGSTVLDLDAAVRSLASGSECQIVIDCHELSFIGSSGLRGMLQIARSQKAIGAGFALCSLSPPITRIFRTSGFDRIISIHDGLEVALEALEG